MITKNSFPQIKSPVNIENKKAGQCLIGKATLGVAKTEYQSPQFRGGGLCGGKMAEKLWTNEQSNS